MVNGRSISTIISTTRAGTKRILLSLTTVAFVVSLGLLTTRRAFWSISLYLDWRTEVSKHISVNVAQTDPFGHMLLLWWAHINQNRTQELFPIDLRYMGAISHKVLLTSHASVLSALRLTCTFPLTPHPYQRLHWMLEVVRILFADLYHSFNVGTGR